MSIARKWAVVAAVSIVSFLCQANPATAQIAMVADNNQLRTLDTEASDPGPAPPIPGANALGIALAPGGLIGWVVDSRGFLQQIDFESEQVQSIGLPRWRGAGGIALTPAGTELYVAVGDSVVPLDLEAHGPNRIMKLISGLSTPWDVVAAPDGKTVYVTDHTANKVIPIDVETNTARRPFAVNNPTYIAITPDSKKLYVASSGTPATVTPINLTTGAASAPIILHDATDPASGAGQLAVDTTGQMVYVAGDYAVMRVEVATDTEDDPIPLNLPANQRARVQTVAIRPDNGDLYVGAGTVVVPIRASDSHVGTPITGFTNITRLVFAPPIYASYDKKVYFLGDSVTAGFGYCGPGEKAVFSGCAQNTPFSNSWVLSNFSLSACAPPTPPDDRCSNNNWQNRPWNAPNGGMWVQGQYNPGIAYSYVIAGDQASAAQANQAEVRNWAVTGSTPADWDPGGQSMDGAIMARGVFADQLESIRNSYVVMTLGANPLLGDYLHVIVGIPGLAEFKLMTRNYDCASTTFQGGLAAPLTTAAGGAGDCLMTQWAAERQADHLYNVYDTLLRNGNRVIAVGYPPVCPWSIGTWQPTASAVQGPSSGNPCNTQVSNGISQQDQAFYLAEVANGLINGVVSYMQNPNLVFLRPSNDWWTHQYYSNNGDSWVFANDTWIHPSAAGHRVLGTSVEAAMCSTFYHWCPNGNAPNVRW